MGIFDIKNTDIFIRTSLNLLIRFIIAKFSRICPVTNITDEKFSIEYGICSDKYYCKSLFLCYTKIV